MSAAIGAFVLLALVLESGGLKDWANRLELGPERTIAVPLANGLDRGLRWTHVERWRKSGLVELAKIGWADDPEEVEEATETATPKAVATKSPASSASVPMPPPLPPLVATVPRKMHPGDPPLESQLPTIAPVDPGKVRTVALAGDSMMAVGLSSTLLRRAPKYTDLNIVKTFKSGTGLARPEVFDWQKEYPAMLKDARPDIVLVAIGANDGQGFVQDGTTYLFGTDGWKAIYRSRVVAYLAMLQSGGATVVWIGLPPMKANMYDAHIALINRIDYDVVSNSPRAIWFSTSTILGDDTGAFQDFGSVDGKPSRLRQQDGIHMTDDGAILLAEKLLPWLAAEKLAAEKAPADSPKPSPVTSVPPVPTPRYRSAEVIGVQR
jgi:hypothetical protein